MKKLRYIAIGAILPLLLSGCGESFLKKDPQGSISVDALKNQQGVEMLCISAYSGLISVNRHNPWQSSPFNWVFGGVYGGDANKGSDPGDQSVINEIELYQMMPTNVYVHAKWGWVTGEVSRINDALKIMAVADMDKDLKTVRRAEMRFLRGLAYFEAYRCFGQYLPYIDESHTENDPKTHNNVDTAPMILEDIEAAIKDLPETQPEVGRPNKWAAKALKAKMLVYLKKFPEAKTLLKDILDNGKTSNGLKYALEDVIEHNYDAHFDNGCESIFAVQYNSSATNTGNNVISLCFPHNSGPGGCCGFYQPSYDLVNAHQVDAAGLPYLNNEYRGKSSVTKYDDDKGSVNDDNIAVDPRLDHSVGRMGIPYKGWGLPKKDWVRNYSNGGVFLPKKHVYSKKEKDDGMYNSFNGWAPSSTMNGQYLNVRDMVLLYAECLAETGDLAGAMAQVNKIRARAANPANIIKLKDGTPAARYLIKEYPSSHAAFSDKAECIKAVRMERRLELAMEGERWFDLARWGGDYMSKELEGYVKYETKYIPKFKAASKLDTRRTVLPVPQNEIDMAGKDAEGKNWLEQNPVWK